MDETENVSALNSEPIFQINYRITAQDYRKSLENYDKVKSALNERRLEEKKGKGRKTKPLPTFSSLFFIVFLALIVSVFATDFETRALGNLIVYSAVMLWIFATRKIAAHRRKKYFDRLTKAGVEAGELDRPEKFLLYSDRAERISTVFHAIYDEYVQKIVECADGIFIIYQVEGKYTFIPVRFFDLESLETLKATANDELALEYYCIEKMQLPEAAERGEEFEESFDRTAEPLYMIGLELTQNLQDIISGKNNQRLIVKAIVFSALMVFCFWISPKHWLLDMLLVALRAIFLLSVLILLYGIRRYLKRDKKTPPMRVEYKFFDDCFYVIYDSGYSRHIYTKIKKIKKYGDVLFVFLSDNTYLCIPKYVTEDEGQFAKFENFIKSRAKNK